MKYFFVAGEASGDLHASELMESLLKTDPNADFKFLGGDKMAKIGGKPLKHYKEMAFMGLWEVLKNISSIKNNLDLCKNAIINYNPDAVILVDYPGFNLKIAEFAKQHNFKTIYYISPKIWAWKQGRIKKIKHFIDKMFVIFPFETEFYKKHGYKVQYLGNPTLHVIEKFRNSNFNKNNFLKINKLQKPLIALLPGSRKQEIEKTLPVMINVSKHFPDYQMVVAGVKTLPEELYEKYLKNTGIKIIFDKTFELLSVADAAVVTSGTATLETALLKVPQVVCYKTSKLTYSVGKIFVKINYFSLVNILMQKPVVKELLQNNLENDIVAELKKILTDEHYKTQMLSDYDRLEKMLGTAGAPDRVAKEIYNFILTDKQ